MEQLPTCNDYELRFTSLFNQGRALAFPCDAAGRVDMDAMNERLLNNYLYARTSIGREFTMPAVCRGRRADGWSQ